MKYKIEIWIYHAIEDTYESDDVKEVLKWYKNKWQYCFDNDGCSFSLLKNNEELSFEEINKLGFFD